MAPSRYWELVLANPADSSEGLTNFLWELGAVGVIEEERADRHPQLRAFFPATRDAPAVEAQLRAYVEGLTALGFEISTEPRVRPVTDENWAEAWRQHFQPLPVGRRLLIAPPWEAGPPGGSAEARVVIVIDPGRAFGTGHHGSTAGCLLRLETAIERERPTEALDLGAGSGILAIAAARLGVEHITAVDDDPDAVACTTANAALNGVADRVHCVTADAATLETPPVPLVVANLLSAAHTRLARQYARYVEADGGLILSGVLPAEAEQVSVIIAAAGFRPYHELELDGWTTLEFRRTR